MLLLLIACSHDFGLESMQDPTASPWNDTRTEADTGEPLDTAPPEEEEIPEEETQEEEEEEPVQEDPAPEDDCEGTSDLIYVVSRSDESLYLFDPDTLSFERQGALECDWISSPSSMAVARDGVAYVRYSDDSVYEVNLETMACSPTSYSSGSFGSFGMGFASDDADTWRDQLYVANDSQVASVDTATWKRSILTTLPSQSELTGNGKGELWAFLPLESPAQVARIDLGGSGIVERVKLPGFPSPYDIDAFAFANWDGAFYLFVREFGMGSSTDVYEVNGSTMTKVMSDVGFDVVGAGVSTCAPS
ncbi:MAG: hypothetical protein ACI9VR_003350 [Cognaticolwellia sp.]|jgi:hypothetical protein